MSERDSQGRFLKGHHVRKPNAFARAKKLAEAAALGEILGKTKGHKKKPLVESAREHIGKVIDNVEPVDGAICAGLAYLGYETIGDWQGALLGPIAYKLATSGSEAGAIAGITGLAMLGFTVFLTKEQLAAVIQTATDFLERSPSFVEPTFNPKTALPECPNGYTLYYRPNTQTPTKAADQVCVLNVATWAANLVGMKRGLSPRIDLGGGTQYQDGFLDLWEAIGRGIPK